MDIIRWKDYDSHSFLKHFLEKLIRLNAYENLNKKKTSCSRLKSDS